MKKFKPAPGQTDYTHARWAPVINCVLKCGNKILLIQRSKKLHFYPGCWNGVSGFLDDQQSLIQKVKSEIKEETGIAGHHIKKITPGAIFHEESKKYKKTWIVHPVLVDVDTEVVKLDWEGATYAWMTPREARIYSFGANFDQVLKNLGLWK